MPPPPNFGGSPVTNIRNTASPHWRGWLKPESPVPAHCVPLISGFASRVIIACEADR